MQTFISATCMCATEHYRQVYAQSDDMYNIIVLYSRKLSREKIFLNFTILRPPQVFLMKILGMPHPLCNQFKISQKFSLRNAPFLLIRESFLSCSAIRYYSRLSHGIDLPKSSGTVLNFLILPTVGHFTLSSTSAGLPPHEGEDEPLEGKPPSLGSGEGRRSTSQSRRGKRRNKAVPISFDDYHALWKGIATSVTSYKQQDECKYHKLRRM